MSDYAIIKLRRDTAANWSTSNPTLQEGEVGISMDSSPLEIRVGDGTKSWSELSPQYFSPFKGVRLNNVECTIGSDRMLDIDETDPAISPWARTDTFATMSVAIRDLASYNGFTNYLSKEKVGTRIGALFDNGRLDLKLYNTSSQVLSSASVDIPISGIVSIEAVGDELIFTLANGETASVQLTSMLSNLVPQARTIAGLPLISDIATSSLLSNLSIQSNTNPISRSLEATFATSSGKLNLSNATGSQTQPVYFNNGLPVVCTSYDNAAVKSAATAGGALKLIRSNGTTIATGSAFYPIYLDSNGVPQIASGVPNYIAASFDTTSQKLTISLLRSGSTVPLDTKEVPIPISGIIGADVSGSVITFHLQGGVDIEVDIAQTMTGLVPSNRLIAGTALTADIPTSSLFNALSAYSLATPNVPKIASASVATSASRATVAEKMSTSKGNSTTPIFLDVDGIPQACSLDYLSGLGGTLRGDLYISHSTASTPKAIQLTSEGLFASGNTDVKLGTGSKYLKESYITTGNFTKVISTTGSFISASVDFEVFQKLSGSSANSSVSAWSGSFISASVKELTTKGTLTFGDPGNARISNTAIQGGNACKIQTYKNSAWGDRLTINDVENRVIVQGTVSASQAIISNTVTASQVSASTAITASQIFTPGAVTASTVILSSGSRFRECIDSQGNFGLDYLAGTQWQNIYKYDTGGDVISLNKSLYANINTIRATSGSFVYSTASKFEAATGSFTSASVSNLTATSGSISDLTIAKLNITSGSAGFLTGSKIKITTGSFTSASVSDLTVPYIWYDSLIDLRNNKIKLETSDEKQSYVEISPNTGINVFAADGTGKLYVQGNVSASGYVSGSNLRIVNSASLNHVSASGNINGSNLKVAVSASAAHISASANISASNLRVVTSASLNHVSASGNISAVSGSFSDINSPCIWYDDEYPVVIEFSKNGSNSLSLISKGADLPSSILIEGDGNITATPKEGNGTFIVDGNITATGTITPSNPSDRKLKKNIASISDADEVLSNLNPVEFDWNETAKEKSNEALKGHARGFVADEFLKIISQNNGKAWKEYDRIDSSEVIPYLVAGYQLQKQEIAALRQEIELLKAKLA